MCPILSYQNIATLTPVYCACRQSLLSLHMTKSYVRTATRSTLKLIKVVDWLAVHLKFGSVYI